MKGNDLKSCCSLKLASSRFRKNLGFVHLKKSACCLDELSDFSDKPKKFVLKPLVDTITPIAQQMYIKSFSIPSQQIGPT
jgi:hypothetical protein